MERFFTYGTVTCPICGGSAVKRSPTQRTCGGPYCMNTWRKQAMRQRNRARSRKRKRKEAAK